MKLNLGSGAHPLDGFVNLDKSYDGWTFESGLTDYGNGTVDAITESHALMYVPLEAWPFVFSEFARVLRPLGVVRITEDATDDPRSERYGGFPGCVTLTSRALVRTYMHRASLNVVNGNTKGSVFLDDSLVQSWHGPWPKTFAIEAVK